MHYIGSKICRKVRDKMDARIIEKLAEYAHDAWSGWMDYMFKKSEHNDGSVIIPKELAERWARQAGTAYKDLPENEKESDREEARRMISIMGG